MLGKIDALLPETARLIRFPAMQQLLERFGGASLPIESNLRCTGDRLRLPRCS